MIPDPFDDLVKSRFIEMNAKWKMKYDSIPLKNYLNRITYGFTNPMSDSDEGPWKITAKDVVNGQIDYTTARKTTTEEYDNLTNKSKPKKNDVLLTKDGTLGRTALVLEEGLCVNQSVAVLTPNSNIVPSFLSILLQMPEYQSEMIKNSGGGTIKHIYITKVEKMLVCVPSKEEQETFVAFVEQLDKSRFIYQQIVSYFDVLIKSRFIEMFGSCDDPKYGLVEISDLVSRKIDKVTKSYEAEDIIQYIDISSINKDSRTIEGTTDYVVKEAPSRAQQCVVSGDILLSNVRPNLKTMAIVNSMDNNLVCSSGFTVLRCDKCEPEYLITAITDDVFTDKLMKKATGSSYPAVTTKDVLSQQIPSGPRDIQRVFANFVQLVDKSKYAIQHHLLKTLNSTAGVTNDS